MNNTPNRPHLLRATGEAFHKSFAKALCLSLLAFPLIPPPAGAQLVGTDTAPNTPCTAKGAVRITANPDPIGTGAYVLTCDDNNGQWIATITTGTPTDPAQAANKDYVDTAIAANTITACTNDTTDKCALETTRHANDPDFIPENIADGVNILGVIGTYKPVTVAPEPYLSGPAECPEIGDLCPSDGTIYAGHHPTLNVPLYIPPTDQGISLAWRSSGTDGEPISVDDGRANTAIIPHEARFPAFKACKDLAFGGHSDWYLPSRVELYALFRRRSDIEVKGNITNFQNYHYWSSTQWSSGSAWRQHVAGGNQNTNNKTRAELVRCVRR